MLFNNFLATAALLLFSTPLTTASLGPKFHGDAHAAKSQHTKRQNFVKQATGLKEFTTPTGVKIRYKEPGKEGICETTEGVDSYSGYIDIAPNVHVFFWFFESRNDPSSDPITLWLNGGPGSDSLIGLFQELGPCRINPDLSSTLNPYSWNNVSNVLFLSQPVGVAFSNQGIVNGSLADYTGSVLNSTYANATATYPLLDPVNEGEIDTTDLAAIAAWHILQGFLSGMSKLDGDLKGVKEFHLWTESYGGHYGPAFYNYFYHQNELINNGTMEGYSLNFGTLGLINAIIDESVQAEYYPEFAVNNTYGIKAYNDTVYNYARFANFMPNGCLDQIQVCKLAAAGVEGGLIREHPGQTITNVATSFRSINSVCQEAADMCRDNVESPYYYFGNRGVYDIRHPYDDPTPPSFFEEYLNTAEVQNAIGVSNNYTTNNADVYFGFQSTGDFIFPNFRADLEEILASGVRVALVYGDADYICNWFGGEAISLAFRYENQDEFAAAGYEPMVYGGVQYGEVREYGNFSFTRIYEAGHEIPYYQPQGSLAVFNRSINYFNIADGTEKVTETLATNGTAETTHTTTKRPLPASSVRDSWGSSLVASYSVLDNQPPPTATGGYKQ
ncbi:hypothetical protein LTR37_002726 [Vermiconidia calcicola]|uniref:Uncharacterized protein n=1 Tax=Vermiconidia calcicola TaxID=1690605 RepID=A0ACC3NRK6_9PEZI|nr:hypothetical protein LTR37_002726 [Vermiconidia calcicola]